MAATASKRRARWRLAGGESVKLKISVAASASSANNGRKINGAWRRYLSGCYSA